MLLMRLRVGFVTVLSCLALLLGLFASSGAVSAHSAQVLHTQTSVSVSTDNRCFRVFEHRFRFFGFGFRRFRRDEGFFRLRCVPDFHRSRFGGMGGGY